MEIRPYTPCDQPRLVELTIETFAPYFQNYYHPLVGDRIFHLQHNDWAQDYRDLVPTLHDPTAHKHIAVAHHHDSIAGYIAYSANPTRHDGKIEILAVSPTHRRQNTATILCEHAFTELRNLTIEVVEISTGADPFHTPARALYESLGCIHVPTAAYLKQL